MEFTERLGRGSSLLQQSGPAVSVNLRDCSTFASNLKPGLLFRSSQVVRFVSNEFAALHAQLDAQWLMPLFLLCSAAEVDHLHIKVHVCETVRIPATG